MVLVYQLPEFLLETVKLMLMLKLKIHAYYRTFCSILLE
jgi:hypothetical protein